MNKQSRKALAAILDELEAQQTALQELADEEREKFDNMPEGLQTSERGEAVEAAADALEEQASNLDDIINELREYTEA